MKIFKVLILSFIGFLLSSSSFGTLSDQTMKEKDITINVSGDLAGKNVVVYVRDGESSRKIMQFKGESSDSRKMQEVSCKRVKIYGDAFELKITVGTMKYVFDVIAEEGMQCTFHKGEDSVYLQRKASEDLSSTEGRPLGDISHDIYMRFSGEIIGKRVELHVDSRLVFDERLQSDLLSYCKEARFKTESLLFNVRVVVDGRVSSFDVDAAKGCYIDFDFRNRYLMLKQYLSEDVVPGLL